MQKYEPFVDFLLEYNNFINLTSIRNRSDALVKHVEDSLVLSDHIRNHHPEARRLLDIGTGAGFPGLVLAKEHPHISITLLDATKKKIRFVEEAALFLGANNACAVADRVEAFTLKNKEVFDVVVVRSVARLDVLLEYAAPLLKKSGYLLAMKSLDTLDEMSLADEVASVFGFNVGHSFPYVLLDQKRSILSYRKIGNPVISLPRKIGEAIKYPIQRRS